MTPRDAYDTGHWFVAIFTAYTTAWFTAAATLPPLRRLCTAPACVITLAYTRYATRARAACLAHACTWFFDAAHTRSLRLH